MSSFLDEMEASIAETEAYLFSKSMSQNIKNDRIQENERIRDSLWNHSPSLFYASDLLDHVSSNNVWGRGEEEGRQKEENGKKENELENEKREIETPDQRIRRKIQGTATRIEERFGAAKRRAEEKVRALREEIVSKRQSECTFTPNITKSKKSKSSDVAVRRMKTPVKEKFGEEIKKQREADVLKDCTFKPQINESSKKVSKEKTYVPIYNRVGQVQREQHQHLVDKQFSREEELSRNASFTPSLNKKSLELATRSREAMKSILKAGVRTAPVSSSENYSPAPALVSKLNLVPVTDLETYSQIKQLRASALYQDLMEREGCTFTPKLDSTSRKIADESSLFKAAPSFFDRQETFKELKNLRLERIAKEEMKKVDCTFRPKLISRSLSSKSCLCDDDARSEVSSCSYRSGHHERILHLSLDGDRFRAARAAKEQNHYSQFTFRPQISQSQKSFERLGLGRISSRTSLSAPNTPRGRALENVEASFKDSYTFNPQLNKKSVEIVNRLRAVTANLSPNLVANNNELARVSSSKSLQLDLSQTETLPERIETWRLRKELEINRFRKIRDEKEIEECTFAPQTLPQRRVSQPQKPVPVPGLSRFFEFRNLALQKKKEQEEREQKVFLTDPSKLESVRSSQPKPFHLESNRRSELRQNKPSIADTEKRDAHQRDYSFHPVTSESKNRHLIRQLLDTKC